MKMYSSDFKSVFLKSLFSAVFTKFSPSRFLIFHRSALKFCMLIPGVILHRIDLLDFLFFVYFFLYKFFSLILFSVYHTLCSGANFGQNKKKLKISVDQFDNIAIHVSINIKIFAMSCLLVM